MKRGREFTSPYLVAFTYSLVSGTGSTDNGSFSIVGNELKTAAGFNFEAKPSYSIRVRTTDQGGLSYEKVFSIQVLDVNDAPVVTAGAGSAAGDEGVLITHSGTWSDEDGDPVTLSASVGDIVQDGNSWTWSYTPEDGPGAETVTISADDGHGGVGSTSFALAVANVAPTAVFASGGVAVENEPGVVGFFEEADSPADLAAGLRYSVSLTEEALAGSYAEAGAAALAELTFAQDGSYPVFGRVFDKDGGYRDYVTTLVVQNAPPVVDISLPQGNTYDEGSTLSFMADATGSGQSLSYEWAVLRDGVPMTLPAGTVTDAAGFSFTPADSHFYSIIVTVTDDTGIATTVVSEHAIAPLAPSGVTASTQSDLPTSATLGWTNNSSSAAFYSIYGKSDGESEFACLGTASSGATSFVATGLLPGASMQFAVVANGSSGGVSSMSAATAATTQPSMGLAATVTVTGMTVDVGFTRVGAVKVWMVDWGDDTTSRYEGTAPKASHVYSAPGSYDVKVSAKDEWRTYGQQFGLPAVGVNVAYAQPTVSVTALNNGPIAAGSSYTLLLSGSDPVGAPLTWTINWGDGKTSSPPAGSWYATHVYSGGGQYEVSASAMAGGTASAVVQMPVNVANAVVPAPSNVQGSLRPGNQIVLTWDGPWSGIDGYRVEYCASANASDPWQTFNTAAGVHEFVMNDLPIDRWVTFKVSTVSGKQVVAMNDALLIATGGRTGALSQPKVTISEDVLDNPELVQVSISQTDGNYHENADGSRITVHYTSSITGQAASKTIWADRSYGELQLPIMPGTQVTADVIVFNAEQQSAVGSDTAMCPLVDQYVAPVLSAATGVSPTSVRLEWDVAPADYSSDWYTVEVSTDGIHYSVAACAQQSNGDLIISGLAQATAYSIRAWRSHDMMHARSVFSNVLSVTTPTTHPAAPTELHSRIKDFSTVELVWADNSDNESGFVVQYSLDGQSFVALSEGMSLTDAGRNEPYASISGLQMGMDYWFRVCAHNSAGDSQWAVLPGPVNIDGVDLDIDSDNDGIVGNGNEENIEDDTDKPGKIIAANDSYWSGYDLNESIPFDFDDAGETSGFVPLRLTLPAWLDLSRAKISFLYDACPLGDEAEGLMRIWRTNSSVRGADDFINADTRYLARELGMAAGAREVTLWVEGVKWSESLGDGRIEVVVDPTGQGGCEGDCVTGTILKVDLAVGCAAERIEEAMPGVTVPVNNEDSDGDGVPGFAEGLAESIRYFERGQPGMPFVPVMLTLSAGVDLARATLRFTYAQSSPAPDIGDMARPSLVTHTGYSIVNGRFRLWTKGPDASRALTDFIPSGQLLTAAQLGLVQGSASFFLEAVASGDMNGEQIVLEVDAFGDGQWILTDQVRVRALARPSEAPLQVTSIPLSPTQARLQFSVPANANAVRLEQLTGPTTWTPLATCKTDEPYIVSNLDPGGWHNVYSFRAVSVNELGETIGVPVRIVTASNDNTAMKRAFSLLQEAEAFHRSTLYYETAGVRGVFDQLSWATKDGRVHFVIDDDLSTNAASYSANTDTLRFRSNAIWRDLVHETTHAMDDQRSLNNLLLQWEAEALAYGIERILDYAAGSISLRSFEGKSFESGTAASMAWKASWDVLSDVLGSDVAYKNWPSPFTIHGVMLPEDVSRITAQVGLHFSEAALRPLYRRHLVSVGFEPGSVQLAGLIMLSCFE